MELEECNNYLKNLEKVRSERRKNDKVYKAYCKKYNHINLTNYHIVTGHSLEEYFKKYGKWFKRGTLSAYKENEAWLMDKNKKYWKVRNESSYLYFEARFPKTPLLIALGSVLALAAVGVGIYFGAFHSRVVKRRSEPVFHDYSEVYYRRDNNITGTQKLTFKCQTPTDINNPTSVKIDWGDGHLVNVINNQAESFELTGDTNIRIYGDIDYFYFISTEAASHTTNQIEKIVYGNNVEQVLGYSSFEADNPGLKEVYISHKVKYLNGYAFQNSNINTVYVGDKVTTIRQYAFQGCFNLKNVRLGENIMMIGDSVFQNCISLETIEIPSKVKTIEDSAFKGCYNLKNVNLSTSADAKLSLIDDYCFEDCGKLESINLPNSVTTLGAAAFRQCVNLKKIKVHNDSLLNTVLNNCFQGCRSLESFEFPQGKEISTGTDVFNGCVNLKSVIIPSNTNKLDDNFFSDCVSLEEINIPSSVTTLGAACFSNCINVKSIVIPSTVIYIDTAPIFLNWRYDQTIKFVGLAGKSAIESRFNTSIFVGCNANIVSGI